MGKIARLPLGELEVEGYDHCQGDSQSLDDGKPLAEVWICSRALLAASTWAGEGGEDHRVPPRKPRGTQVPNQALVSQVDAVEI